MGKLNRRKFCACGCGTVISPTATWAAGHSQRGINCCLMPPKPIPNHHECACGCGKLVASDRMYYYHHQICSGRKRKNSIPIPNHHECACGCGELIDSDKVFKHGHNNRGNHPAEESREKMRGPKSDIVRINMKVAANRPEVGLKKSIALKITNAKPEVHERRSQALKEVGARPEVIARRLATVTITNAKPEVHERRSKAVTEAQNRPEVKNRRVVTLKKTLTKPDVKARRREIAKEFNARPGVKENKRRIMKEKWQDPEFAKMMWDSQCRFPNKPEQFWTEVLPERYPQLEWEYTGDFSFIINGKSPDFVSKKYKLVIEFNGTWWHRNDIPGEREGIFAEKGWKTFIINEVEMQDMEKLYQRLDQFCIINAL